MSTHTVSVRRADRSTDWSAATLLLHEYVEWIRAVTDFDPFVEQPSFRDELMDLAGHYSNPDTVLLVGCLGDDVVGTLAVLCRPQRDAELKRMYVDPRFRGRGVADALLEAAFAAAGGRGCVEVWLESVAGSMDSAISVYGRHGFRVDSNERPTIDVSGVVVMRRPLSTTPMATSVSE